MGLFEALRQSRIERQARSAAATAATAAAAAAAATAAERAHERLVEQAAGIGVLQLICHPETLDSLQRLMLPDHKTCWRGWRTRIPEEECVQLDDGSGLVAVDPSGVRVVAVLQATDWIGNRRDPVARRLYRELAAAVTAVAAGAAGQTPTVRLDDRAAPATGTSVTSKDR